ncbi:FAD-binding protein [Cryptosporangium sp. NPDC051539]|uniref:FAD-dependent oxidoreductase n=1 Tax=Cryptosporangium sp. NPDC051539 TaxID=3363962 RepID=UPI0037BCE48A
MRSTLKQYVYRPGDAEYEQVSGLGPAAVAFPRSPAEAAAVVRTATVEGLRVAPIGSGQNTGPFGDLSDTVLVRTGYLNTYDFNRRIARVGAGATWGPLVDVLGKRGLAVLHGSSPDTGVVGYTLGGGVGWYGRALGLAANTVAAVELVTADGGLVRADESHEAELFWALRGGGGGNYGLVTALELRLEWIRNVYAGMLVWDLRDAERVLPQWAEWAANAPDAVTTVYRQVQFPVSPDIPEALRGRRLVIIGGAVLASDGEAEQMLGPLRRLRPRLDTFRRGPARELVEMHADTPAPGGVQSVLLREAPSVDRLLADSSFELRQLGGALSHSAPDAGALDQLDGQFLLLADERTVEAMAPWASGQNYLPFTHRRVDPATGFAPEVWPLLRQIRRRVDPSGVFRANHEIPL